MFVFKFIRNIYDWMGEKVDSPHALFWLFLLFFIESSIFFIPVDPKKYMYLALVGKMSDEESEEDNNVYAAQLLVRLPEEIVDETIQGEIEYFCKKCHYIDLKPIKE